jgi:hypothetical protein
MVVIPSEEWWSALDARLGIRVVDVVERGMTDWGWDDVCSGAGAGFVVTLIERRARSEKRDGITIGGVERGCVEGVARVVCRWLAGFVI